MSNLKECPFCGSKDYLFVGNATEIERSDCNEPDDENNFAVCCDFLQGGCGSASGYESSIEKAIEKWNRRAND